MLVFFEDELNALTRLLSEECVSRPITRGGESSEARLLSVKVTPQMTTICLAKKLLVIVLPSVVPLLILEIRALQFSCTKFDHECEKKGATWRARIDESFTQ